MPSFQNCTVTQMECRHCQSVVTFSALLQATATAVTVLLRWVWWWPLLGCQHRGGTASCSTCSSCTAVCSKSKGCGSSAVPLEATPTKASVLCGCAHHSSTQQSITVDTPTAEHQLVCASLHCTCILRRHMLCKLIRV